MLIRRLNYKDRIQGAEGAERIKVDGEQMQVCAHTGPLECRQTSRYFLPGRITGFKTRSRKGALRVAFAFGNVGIRFLPLTLREDADGSCCFLAFRAERTSAACLATRRVAFFGTTPAPVRPEHHVFQAAAGRMTFFLPCRALCTSADCVTCCCMGLYRA